MTQQIKEPVKFEVVGRHFETEIIETVIDSGYDDEDGRYYENTDRTEEQIEILTLKCPTCGNEFPHPAEMLEARCPKCGTQDYDPRAHSGVGGASIEEALSWDYWEKRRQEQAEEQFHRDQQAEPPFDV